MNIIIMVMNEKLTKLSRRSPQEIRMNMRPTVTVAKALSPWCWATAD
jgi:hypothetical protein